MRSAILAWLIFGCAFAQAPLEDFFVCEGDNVSAKVFVRPQIFCSNQKLNPGVFMLNVSGRSNLFKGELVRWDDGEGESFFHSRTKGGKLFELSMTLPYGEGEGVLAVLVDGETRLSAEMTCVTKQIHVDCP